MKSENQTKNLPVFNIKAVSQMSGLLPVTVRAWERRYGLPQPFRTDRGYRLYSEQDVKVLLWLKAKVESGMSISRAMNYLLELRSIDQDPTLVGGLEIRGEQMTSASQFGVSLKSSILHFDETKSSEVLRSAFVLLGVEMTLVEVIQPTLVSLGDDWHRGEISIATEHFASNFFMQFLMAMLNTSAPPTRNGVIIAACAPGEMHQIGLLMLTVMLRWRGWNVKYFGCDLNLDKLGDTLIPLHPSLLLFSATLPTAVYSLSNLSEVLKKIPEPKPVIVLGGQAFMTERFSDSIPVVHVNGLLSHSIAEIEALMR
jgi:MerR family transcriptional regulator, light-induced transcriptional regulator